MAVRAEKKALDAAAYEAAGFYRGAGEDRMTAENRVIYDEMMQRVVEASKRYDRACRESTGQDQADD